jgi:hypothetical protein
MEACGPSTHLDSKSETVLHPGENVDTNASIKNLKEAEVVILILSI